MKTSLVSLLCYVSLTMVSGAQTIVWYDKAGICHGFYSHVPTVGCGEDGDRMTSIPVTNAKNEASAKDGSFDGYKLGDTQLVDENGNIVATPEEVVAAINSMGGTNVSSIGASYSCTGGKQQSASGVCYESDATYINFEEGFEENGYQLAIPDGGGTGDGGKGCQYYRDFDVVIHWAPRDYEDIVTTPYSYSTGLGSSINISPRPIDWTGIPKNASTSNYHYHWDGGMAAGRWTQNGSLVKKIYIPESHPGWTLRGLYLMNYAKPENAREPSSSASGTEKQEWINYLWTVRARADNLVSEATNTYSTARLGFLPGQTDLGYIDVEDDGAWGNSYTRWSIWSCTPITTVHMYAGWTRNCAKDMCHLTVKANGLHNNNDRGDVFYDTGSNRCPDGTQPKDGNTYNPSCEGASSTISYSYAKYRDATTGENVSCKNGPTGGTCQINNSTVALAAAPTNLSCGTGTNNYRFYKWMTQDTVLRDPESTIDCTVDILGTSPANVTGLLCNCGSATITSRCAMLCAESNNGDGGNGDGNGDGENGDGEGGKGVNVTLTFSNGTLKDSDGEDAEGTMTVVVDKGGNLSGYAPETEIGQPEFTGWQLKGSTGGASDKNAVVNAEAGSNVEYIATFACPEGTSNFNGTCLTVGKGEGEGSDGETEILDTIIDKGGNPVDPTQGATCWRDAPGGGRVNYCYWYMTIEFHGKPAGSSLNVSDPNDGKQMYCTGTPCKPLAGMTCAEYFADGVTCRRMHVPTASGYKFRGYYRPTLPSTMITSASTVEGAAFSKFYPGVDFGKHATIIMNDTPVTNYTYPEVVHVYGAWAADCNPGEHATCNRTISTAWAVSNGMNKGDVRYDTGCDNGYVISSGANTATPTCETEKGNNITISYTFKDQFGRTVNSSGATSSCVAAENFSLPNSSFVQSTLGSNYSPKYFAMTDVNGSANWYTAGRSLMCGTNTFGPMTSTSGGGYSASVVGTVCYNFCTIGQRYGEHGTCIAMTGNGPTAEELGISYPTYYASNGGYYIVNGSYNVANLWEGCPTVQCDSATGTSGVNYGLYVDPNGTTVSCVDKSTLGGDDGTSQAGGGSFTCPNYTINGVTVTKEKISTDGCRYTLSCSGNRVELEGATNTTATCYGNTGSHACTTAYLDSQFGNAQCVFQCPMRNTSGFGDHYTLIRYDSVSGNTCKYKVMCHANCSADDCRLTYNDAIVTNAKGGAVYVTCTGNDCYSSMQTNSSNINENLHFDNFSCQSVASMSSTYKCPWASWFTTGHLASAVTSEHTYIGTNDTFNLLNNNGITMSINTNTPVNGQCTYTLGCSTSGQTPTPVTFTCSGYGNGNSNDNSCNVANMRARLMASYPSCGAAPQYTCPTTGLPTIENGSISNPSACNYQVKCNSGYTCDTVSTVLCTPKTCNSEPSCNSLFAQYSSHASDLCKETTPSTGTCPTITAPNYSTVSSTPSTSNYSTSCTYTIRCNDGYLVAGTSSQTTSQMFSGSNIEQSAQNWANGVTCKINCPTNGISTWGGGHGSVTKTDAANSCTYSFSCDGDYNLTPSSPTSYTCTGTTGSNGCSASWLTAKLESKSCESNAPTFTCPDNPTVVGGNGTISHEQSDEQCNYTLKCSTGYAEPNNNTTHTCTGTACNSGSNSVTTWANGVQCIQKVTCPDAGAIAHGEIIHESINNGTACKYTARCHGDGVGESGAYKCDDTSLAICSSNGYVCNSEGECNAYFVGLNPKSDTQICVFHCPSKSFVMSKLGHVSALATNNTTTTCKYTPTSCEACYSKNTSETPMNCADDDNESCNTSFWSGHSYCYWDGAGISGCGDAQ